MLHANADAATVFVHGNTLVVHAELTARPHPAARTHLLQQLLHHSAGNGVPQFGCHKQRILDHLGQYQVQHVRQGAQGYCATSVPAALQL